MQRQHTGQQREQAGNETVKGCFHEILSVFRGSGPLEVPAFSWQLKWLFEGFSEYKLEKQLLQEKNVQMSAGVQNET